MAGHVRKTAVVAAAMLLASVSTLPAATSTLVGVDDWTDYGNVTSAPPVDLLVGTWTHVQPPMGSGTKGNDYPFLIGCSEGFNVICVSGNIGYDAGYGAWYYNANTMTRSGDHVTVYLHGSEAVVRDWVYVAWHFQRNGSRTTTTQYVKLGVSAPMEQVAQETVSETYTPTRVYLGGGPACWGACYMQYARLYAMSSIPSTSAVNAIAMRAAPDAAAWGDWPMIDGGTADVSGNGRTVTVSGTWRAGIDGPVLGTTAVPGTPCCAVTVAVPSGVGGALVCSLTGRAISTAGLPVRTGDGSGCLAGGLYVTRTGAGGVSGMSIIGK